MAIKNTIIGKLNSKAVELDKSAQAGYASAKSLEAQIDDLRLTAASDSNKAKAIDQALAILSKAGVEV